MLFYYFNEQFFRNQSELFGLFKEMFAITQFNFSGPRKNVWTLWQYLLNRFLTKPYLTS